MPAASQSLAPAATSWLLINEKRIVFGIKTGVSSPPRAGLGSQAGCFFRNGVDARASETAMRALHIGHLSLLTIDPFHPDRPDFLGVSATRLGGFTRCWRWRCERHVSTSCG